MENREIARLLSETADLMEIAGEDPFRIRSYRNAASAIENYPDPVSAILRDATRKVTDIPGIGKGIASVLQEIEQRGSSRSLRSWQSFSRPSMVETRCVSHRTRILLGPRP